MRWIESISVNNGTFEAIAVNLLGTKTPHTLGEVTKSAKEKTNCQLHKAKLESDFSDWRATTANDYLKAFGMSCEHSDKHRVFEFTSQGTTYYLPALILIRAMCRPFQSAATFLFRPQGLEQFCIAMPSTASVQFYSMCVRKRQQQAQSLLRPLSWMSSFPSARRFWDSIYKNACSGMLACDLPIGQVRMKLTGQQKQNEFWVKELTILQIQTNESAYEFAREHTKTIVFHESNRLRNAGALSLKIVADKHLMRRDGQWTLTDDEWNEICPIITPKFRRVNRRKHDLRELMDGIIGKFANGQPWTKTIYKTGTWQTARKLYGECQTDLRWQKVRAILAITRPAHDAP